MEMLFKNILPVFHTVVLTLKSMCACVREREGKREVEKGKVTTYFGISCYF